MPTETARKILTIAGFTEDQVEAIIEAIIGLTTEEDY